MRACLLLPALLLLSACEVADSVESRPVHEASFLVRYRVDGTYASCSISYRDEMRTLQREDVAPGWEKTLSVRVRTDQAPFEALVQATCADPSKTGKVTVSLTANTTLVAVETTAGFGATARAAGYLTGSGTTRPD